MPKEDDEGTRCIHGEGKLVTKGDGTIAYWGYTGNERGLPGTENIGVLRRG